jgi:hypothetical protein
MFNFFKLKLSNKFTFEIECFLNTQAVSFEYKLKLKDLLSNIIGRIFMFVFVVTISFTLVEVLLKIKFSMFNSIFHL